MKCINLKAPAFKAKMKKYKASAGNLEFHILKWQLDTGQVWDTDTDATVEAYLDNVYKLSSQNIFDNYKQYQTAKELWDKVNDYLMFETEQEALDVYKEMVDAFGAEHVIKYQDDTNHWIVKIAEPLYDNGKEIQRILKQAPRDEHGRLLAPNGKPSNLTEQQYAQVRTKAFKEWFGDWENDPENASKVIDENGEPMVVYHGGSLVDIFDTSGKSGRGAGIKKGDTGAYFTNILHSAKWYEEIHSYKNSYVVSDIIESLKEQGLSEEEITNEWNTSLLSIRSGTRYFFLNIKNPKFTHYTLNNDGVYNQEDKNVNENDGQIITRSDTQELEFVAYNQNQIKSATDNVGTFSRENDNIYYQKSLAEELQKLRTYNRPIGQAGSAKKQKEAMRKTGADPVLINLVLSLLEKNPSLGSLTPVEILQTISKALNKDIAEQYYEYILQPINKALEQHLINYLALFGIEVKENSPLLKKYGVTGAYDIINKIIHIAKVGERNALTLTEEFAHAFVELMGVVPNVVGRGKNAKITPDVNSPHNYDFSYLMEAVTNTAIYKLVYEQYKGTYLKEDNTPDVEKIKKEAIGQALAVAIQNNWIAKNETEQTFWDKLKAWFLSIIDYFKDVEYINFETLLNKIADEIVNNDTSRLKKVDSTNYLLLKYTDTIVNLNEKDGGKALSFMRYFTELGNIITGSLSYRLQGEVYRGALDSLHDIDMVVPQSAHGIDLTSDAVKDIRHEIWERHQSGLKNHTELFKRFAYFKTILKQYPKLKLGSMFPSGDGTYYTINGVYSENPALSERFLSLTGSYASRLEKFTEEERGLIYLFDFFLKPNDDELLNVVKDTQYGLNLAPYSTSIKEKQFNMGRAKDIFDYQMWRTYAEFKEHYVPTEETLMFQKANQLLTPFEQTSKAVDELIEKNNKLVKRSDNFEEDHKYLVKQPDGTWKAADSSVTELYGKSTIDKDWGLVSSVIGTEIDNAVRTYFDDDIKSYKDFELYTKRHLPNLYKQGDDTLRHLWRNLVSLHQYILDQYGENCRIITDEFPLVANYALNDKSGVVVGTMDMLVIDEEGNLHILDMKTTRSSLSFSKNTTKYQNQLTNYGLMLEASHPQLKGKVKSKHLIRFDVNYPNPKETSIELVDGKLIDTTTKEIIPITVSLHTKNDKITDDTLVPIANLEESHKVVIESYNQLSKEEQELIDETIGDVKQLIEKPHQQSERSKQWAALNNTKLLTQSLILFAANTAMNLVSYLVNELQKGTDWVSELFGIPVTNTAQGGVMGASREYILNHPEKLTSLSKILDMVKELYFCPSEDMPDGIERQRLQLLYDNFDVLKEKGNNKLILLEDYTVTLHKDDVTKEGVDDQLSEDLDSKIEENLLERWLIGDRQLSAKSRLSVEIRRMFENLPILDENGEQVVDDILGLPLFVDSHTAVNYILEWCKDCETIEEMEEILTAKNESGDFNWTSSILEAIKSEPFRSKFFNNFRKDWTQYSIILMETDFETGKKKAVLHVINSNDAVTTMMKDIKAMYTGGLMSHIIKVTDENLDGRGKVNMAFVNNSKKVIDELIHKVKTTNKYGLTQSDITKLVNLLKEFGVVVQEDILKKAISLDSKQRMSLNTVRMKILNNLNLIVTSMENNKDNIYYSPLLDNLKQEGIPEIGSNVYSNYKNIVSLFSLHLPNTIESSAYQNGKMYYSFVTPSAMGSIIRNLKDALHNENKFDNYIQKYFELYTFFYKDGKWLCPWLDEIVNGKGKDLLDHKVQLAYNNIDYTELSELDYTVSLLNEYFADQSNSKSKYAWYRVPILSNKPSSEFIKFKRYTGLRTQYQKELTQGFLKIFNLELLRMKTVLEAAALGKEAPIKNFDISKKQRDKHKALFDKIKTNLHEKSYGITFDDLVKDGKLIFEESGASFKFLEIFNQEIINKTEVGKYILSVLNNEPTRSEELKRTFATEFGRILTDNFNTMLDNAMEQWEQLGLFEVALDKNKQPYLKHLSRLSLSNTASLIKKLQAKDPSLKDPKNIEKLNEKIVETLKEEARPQLEEWLWNDTFATINIIEITATDLAYYKNVEDFQKRYAQLHSPTNKLNTSATFTLNGREIRYSADGLSRTMYIADNTVVSDMIASVETIFDRKIEEAKRNGNKEQAKQLERLKSVIIDSKDGFKNINVADAQGYSSPTSYRKKLGMMGQWTDEMERAYQEIRNGNWNIENFNVVWQPLKPFVYTKVHKNTDGLTLETMPVPSQHKNSEYLLLIADAIISSDREIAATNKLKGIFDFMEATAYTRGQYNGIGIDTIQFESAIKSGLSGVVDINQATTAKEVFDILVKHARGRKDVDEIYNENYVHTFEFSDYGIQQPVPAHLQGQQLMGSQIRILSVSDIQNPNTLINLSYKNGNLMTIGQARDEYMALVAENIRESYNDLIKELKLKGTRKLLNEALAQLLREAILKDQRFGGDLLFACELNKDGEFNIPLNDPIQSVRIQQLLNSIIKSRINKLKIAGGPVVQTSMYGLDLDLSIRFKTKDNKLLDTYKEWCKKHNKKMNEASAKAYKKYVSDEQGSLAYYECLLPIPDSEMQKALTKTDGSLMSVEEALNAGIISEECLEAIGYRIPTEDKYSMYPMKIVGFLPSSEEIVMLPKEITLITGSDFDIDKTYIMLKLFKKGKINLKKLKEYLKSQKIQNTDSIANLMRDVLKDGGTILEALKYLDYTESTAVQEYLRANTSTKLFERDDEGSNGRNNRIFDLMYAILTSEETADKMFNPGSFNTQKRSARIITILKNNPGKYTYKLLQAMELEELEDLADAASKQNITSVLTQVAFHKQNMTAGKLIGIFANNNTSHAFLAMQNISLNFADNGFNFDGVSVTNHQNNKLDNILALDGFTLISKNIAGFLAASVDAVKDPVLNYMNLNTCTSGVAMLLARLGFDSDSIGLFLTQPIIEELTRKWITINNSGYASISDVIGQMLLKYDAAHVESLRKSLNQESFNKEKFAKQFSKPNTDFEIRTLLLFEKLSGTAQHLSTLTFLTKFNSVTNAVGPMIADTLVMENRKHHFINEVMNSDNPPFSYEAKYVIENNPILEAFYETTVGLNGASKLIFQNHFPHYSAGFLSLLQQLTQVVKAPLDSKTINNLVNFYMLYKMSMESESLVYNGSYESRREFMLEFPKVFEERVRNIKNGNLLLDIITLQPKTKKCPTVTLSAKTGGYTTDIQENIKHAWADLIQIDPLLAIDLFKYNMYRTGFTFSPKTFLHLAPSFVKLNIPGYVDCLRNPEFLDDNLIGLEFEILMLFLRNYMDSYKLVPRVNDIGITKSDKKPYIVVDIGKNGNKQVLINTKGDSKFVAPVIVYDDVLYYTEQSELTNGEQQVYYYPTTRLGVLHDFIEVDGAEQDSANMVSVFSNNNKKKGNKKKTKTPEKLPPSDNDNQDMTPQKTDTDYVVTDKDKEVINKALNALRLNGLMHIKDEQQLDDLETISDVVKFITHLYNKIENPGKQLSKLKEEILTLNKKICK